MSSSRKLIIAAALLAVGYGVASFLGSPRAPYLSPTTRAALEADAQWRSDQPARANVDAAPSLAGARLYPEIAPNIPLGGNGALAGSAVPVKTEPSSFVGSVTLAESGIAPAESSSPALLPTAIDAEPLLPGAPPIAGMPSGDSVAPVARTSIAPIMTRVSPAGLADAIAPSATENPSRGGQLIDAHWNVPEPSLANGASAGVTIGSTPVLTAKDVATASFAAPSTSPTLDLPQSQQPPLESAAGMRTVPAVPPPSVARSAAGYSGELRRHIVVDGDSLERLAGRYLNDPGRSSEIFELNRELLEHPELLPIGAELKIPPRPTPQPSEFAVASSTGQLPSGSALQEAAAPGVAPIRPVPDDSTNAPRAQLLRPLPAGWSQDVAD